MACAARILDARGYLSAPLDSRVLMKHVLDISDTELFMALSEPAEPEALEEFARLVEKRVEGMPVAYITGSREFMSLDFMVDRRCLIPRPETEVLVEYALDLMEKFDTPRVLDLCTGSGCVAVSLAYYGPEAWISASDISEDALEVARRNASIHGMPIAFYSGDLFAAIPEGRLFDIIVCNPPYITPGEMKNLPDDVFRFEPHCALVSEKQGLQIAENIISNAFRHLVSGGYLAMEIHSGHAKKVVSLFKKRRFKDIVVVKDLSERDRIVCGRLK